MKIKYNNKKTLISFSLLSSLLLLIVGSCIEEFNPKLKNAEDIIAIDGSLIKGEEIQQIFISKATDVNNPEFSPISGCTVYVTDDKGNTFNYEEQSTGIYEAEIPESALELNANYVLHVMTKEGLEFKSKPEPLLESSPIDSVYYEIESNQTSSSISKKGLQFYVDLKTPENATRNYRWVVEETWEILTHYEIDGYYDLGTFEFPLYNPISDSINLCWDTDEIREIFTSSTANLVVNEKKKIPLNYVPGTSLKLDHKYSILVKQLSLSDGAYEHWHIKYLYSKESGGLYQNQPHQSVSNIYNVDDPDEKVLGYFGASASTEYRVFFTGPLMINHPECRFYICRPEDECSIVGKSEAVGKRTQKKRIFLVAAEFHPIYTDSVVVWYMIENQLCIDCTAEGGTTEKPEFWQ